MDINLFTKYKILSEEIEKEKGIVKKLLKESCNLDISETKIKIEKKKVTLFLSSSERFIFTTKKGGVLLVEQGYRVKLS